MYMDLILVMCPLKVNWSGRCHSAAAIAWKPRCQSFHALLTTDHLVTLRTQE